MAQCKASQVDNFVAKPDKTIAMVLLYGPDLGLVSERADKLITNYGINLEDPMAVSRFDADDIASDPGKLADEAYAISMFGGAKIIRIKGATRKDIQKLLKPILQDPPPECWIIYEGGDLKRDSALRKLAEKSPAAMALPCFQDSAAALEQLIREEITSNNLSMDRDTKTYLKSLLGDDRRASRNELKKLALFAHGQTEISQDQIAALLGNVSAVVNSDIIDAACLGRVDFLQTRLDQLIAGGMSPDMLISATLRHFQLLHRMRATMDAKKTSAATLVAMARPPIHFSRRDSVTGALRIWTMDKIEIALARLNTAFYETRSKPALARSIAATTLLATALLAKRGSH
jgi:DNA polymerase-3 subunit delta